MAWPCIWNVQSGIARILKFHLALGMCVRRDQGQMHTTVHVQRSEGNCWESVLAFHPKFQRSNLSGLHGECSYPLGRLASPSIGKPL